VHTNEFSPLLEDYVHKYGGAQSVDEFRAFRKEGSALFARWFQLSAAERQRQRAFRPPYWVLPAANTLDLATAGLPALLYERLQEQGSDFAVVYPNFSLFPQHSGRGNLRQVLCRALNHYHADLYRPYADRLTPVAAIPLHTPQEGIEELEFAVRTLGLKTAIIPGAVRRPIRALAEKYPPEQFPEVAWHAQWLDFLAIDSEYDYDPFWAKTVELGVNPTTHTVSMGWSGRASISNYMFNHIGHFADASQAFAKALFFGGVTRRFPKLRVALLEGGASWGAEVFTHLVDRYQKRNRQSVHHYNPERIDPDVYYEFFRQFGGDLAQGRDYSREEVIQNNIGLFSRNSPRPEELDDFALADIHSIEDIRDCWVTNFYFGNEADDRTVVNAFNTRATPLNTQVNVLYSSDFGHWDVPDGDEMLFDTWQLVEEGAISAENFRHMVSEKPYEFYTANNPDFFKGTAVEQILEKAG
jgi:predicted TIM-barrel fold metal-dependent hydrolase